MTALLLALVIAQERTVTFTHPCAHSSVVLEAFGKEIGETIKPSGSVDKDYFMVHFVDVPISVAYEKIAETLNATWKKGESVTYLTRTIGDINQEKRLESERFRELLQKNSKDRPIRPKLSEQDIHEILRAGIDSGREYSRYFLRNLDTPSRQFMGDLYRWLLKNNIGLHDFKSELILSENPGWLSRRMPDGFAELHRKYNDLKEIWSSAENRLNSDPQLSTQTFDSFWVDQRWDLDDKKHRIDLVGLGGHYWLNVNSYGNAKGNRTMGYGVLYIEMPDSDVFVPEDIKYDKEYLALANGWMFGFDDGGGFRPVKERKHIMDLLKDHAKSDMLGHVISPALITIAKATEMNVVALLPDSQLMYWGSPSMLLIDGIDQFELFLEGWGTEKIDEQNRFIQISPMWPSEVREDRFERAAFVAAAEAVAAKEKVIPAISKLLYGGDKVRNSLYLGETLGILTSVSFSDYSPFIYSGDWELLMMYQGVRDRMTKRADKMQFTGTVMDLPAPFRKEVGRYLLTLMWNRPDSSVLAEISDLQESAIDTVLSSDGMKTRFTLTYSRDYLWGYEDEKEETLHCEFELVNGLVAASRMENGTGIHIRFPAAQRTAKASSNVDR